VWHDLCAVAGGEGDAPVTPSAGCKPVGDGNYQANGLLETGEPGIGGVLVELGAGACPASGLATAITGMDGSYTFTGLRAGTYCVAVHTLKAENAPLLPGGWTFPATKAGSSVASYTVNLQEGEHKTPVDFGWDYEFLPVPEPVPPQPSPTPEPTTVAECTDKASFVSDVTIPDNTRLLPGQSFVKTWRLRNDGTCTWTTDYALVFAGGDRLGGPTAIPLPQSVPPGHTVDLSVMLTAPAGNGTYKGKWQLRNAEGRLFGVGKDANNPFWVRIVVAPAPQPTAVPATATPAPVFDGWRGEYFGNRDLGGDPVLVRDDAAINFNWGAAAPAMGLPADAFSVRWKRTLRFQEGTYRFYVQSDDGVRVWLDGELIINQWRDGSDVIDTAERTLSGAAHTLRVEYYENLGTARILFWWERLGAYQWRGAFFSNADLAGAPTLMRDDTVIDFDWGHNAPAAGLPADGFSARWTRTVAFEDDYTTFTPSWTMGCACTWMMCW
jgi:hypothetical protein